MSLELCATPSAWSGKCSPWGLHPERHCKVCATLLLWSPAYSWTWLVALVLRHTERKKTCTFVCDRIKCSICLSSVTVWAMSLSGMRRCNSMFVKALWIIMCPWMAHTCAFPYMTCWTVFCYTATKRPLPAPNHASCRSVRLQQHSRSLGLAALIHSPF